MACRKRQTVDNRGEGLRADDLDLRTQFADLVGNEGYQARSNDKNDSLDRARFCAGEFDGFSGRFTKARFMTRNGRSEDFARNRWRQP